MKKRIFCLALALLMLVGMLPVGVFAEGKTEYEKNETGTAVFNYDLLGQVAYITDDPTLGLNASGDYTITVDEALLSQTFYIADSYVGEREYWYKLEPLDGETMPAKLSAKPWVYQNDIPTGDYADALIITPPANTCRCCESCTGAEDCECGCGECDYCEPVTTDPTTPSTPENPCKCCENCTGAEDCECGCENCQFCEPEGPEYPILTDPDTKVEVTLETLPEGVNLEVDPDADVSQQLSEFGIPAANKVFGMDISLISGGAEYQPDAALVKVPVNAAPGTMIGILHTHGSSTTFLGLTEVLADNTVEFYTDSFSEFAGFTVDFHYGGVDYSIAGLTSIKLSELFTAMRITEDASQATAVTFSDPSLVEVTDLGDDWLLTSKTAFDTNETLIVTFTDYSIVIDVTDDKVISDNIWYNSGTNRHIATVSMTVGNLTSVTNKGRFYLYRSSAPETDRVELFDGEKNEARLRKNGDTRATLVINELERGNDWFYVTAERCDIWLPSDNPFAVEIKPTSGSNQPVHVDRIDRTITSEGAAGVYQKRYISANESYDNRVVKIVVNDNENHPYSENVQGLFAFRSGYEWNQLDVQYISYNDYFYGSNDLRSEQSKNTTDGRNHYNPDTQANFYSYNSGVYTIPLKTRYYITFHGNTATYGSMEVQPFIWSESKKLSPNRYIKAYEVIYNANGGSVSTTDANTKSTATFLGWAESPSGAVKYGLDVLDVPVSNLSGDPGGKINLYAKWSDMSTVILPNPTKPSGTIEFLGWYNSNGIRVGGAGDNYTPTADEEELIARWEYSINYNLNEGTVNHANPSSYNIETDTFTLTNPTKTGYTFDGWTGTGLTQETQTVTIPTGSTGNRSYTANWTPKTDATYTVHYYLENTTTRVKDDLVATGKTYGQQYSEDAPAISGYSLADGQAATQTVTAGYSNNVITFYYKQDTVSYTIQTFLENANDDGYTMTSSTGTGITGAIATVTPEAPDGFVYKETGSVTSGTITGDGSLTLKVYFDRIEYTVALEKGTGIASVTGAGSYKYGAPVTIDAQVSANYTWKNWTSDAGSSTTTKQYTFTMPAGNVTYTANASVNTYTVTWVDGNGNTLKTDTVDHGGSVTYSGSTPTKTTAGGYSYTFSHWDKGTNGTVSNITTATVVTAQFTAVPINYTATFDPDGGTVSPTSSTYSIVNRLSLPTPEKAGYNFQGWRVVATNGNWTTGNIHTGAVSDKYGDVQLKAVWEAKKTYTVTVLYNSSQLQATGLDSYTLTDGKWQKTVEEDTLVSLRFAPKSGYQITDVRIDGISLGTDLSGNIKDYAIKSDTTFEIVSDVISYSIAYDLDGGSLPEGSTNPTSYNVDSDSITLVNPVKPGYTFKGWTGTGCDDPTMEVIIPTGSSGARSYKANWDIGTAKVTYTYSGEVPAGAQEKLPAEAIVDIGASVTVAEAPTLDGYTFSGWTTSDVTVTDGKFTMPAKAVTFTGSWSVNQYTVTYQYADDKTADKKVAYTIEDQVTLEDTPTRDGYKFDGWKLSNVTGTNWTAGTFNAGAQFSGKYGNVTFVAQWEAKTYTITYNHNDKDTNPTTSTVSYDIEDELTLNDAPSREGYKFSKWNLADGLTAPNGNWAAGDYNASQQIAKGKYGNIELVAQWTDQYRYVLKFNANTTDQVSNMPQNADTNWIDAETHTFQWDKVPTRANYDFLGWATSADATEAQFQTSYEVSEGKPHDTEEVTLYAVWQRQTGDLKLTFNGDDKKPAIVTVSGEGLNITVVLTKAETVIKDLPTGDYTVTAESGSAQYAISNIDNKNPEIKDGETTEVNIEIGSRGLNWFTAFFRVKNECK